MRLILNDGTIIDSGQAWLVTGVLRCFFNGYTINEAATLFLDATKTAHIIYDNGETQETFDGYTICTSIDMDVEGYVHIGLEKGVEA